MLKVTRFLRGVKLNGLPYWAYEHYSPAHHDAILGELDSIHNVTFEQKSIITAVLKVVAFGSEEGFLVKEVHSFDAVLRGQKIS
jgi:hypothetical protein